MINLIRALLTKKDSPPIRNPPIALGMELDREMVELMELYSKWPEQTEAELARLKTLKERGVDRRLERYIEERTKPDPMASNMRS